MSIDANARLIYGFIRDSETANLFDAIETTHMDKYQEGDEDGYAYLEDMHPEAQEKHGVSLARVGGDAEQQLLSAYSAHVCCRSMGTKSLETDDIAKTSEYNQNIKAFLEDIGVPAETYTPGWHLLSYKN